MPVLEPVEAVRVVATPAALDEARWDGEEVDVLRIAPDEALGIGAIGVLVDGDPDAIVEEEVGFAVALLGFGDLLDVADHVDWELPESDGFAQGKIAGVPAKLFVGEPSILIVQLAYVDDLERRLGWR